MLHFDALEGVVVHARLVIEYAPASAHEGTAANLGLVLNVDGLLHPSLGVDEVVEPVIVESLIHFYFSFSYKYIYFFDPKIAIKFYEIKYHHLLIFIIKLLIILMTKLQRFYRI